MSFFDSCVLIYSPWTIKITEATENTVMNYGKGTKTKTSHEHSQEGAVDRSHTHTDADQ
jgi:hypothetical protein